MEGHSEVTENWLPIAGYERLYEVSDQGRVKRVEGRDCRGHLVVGKVLKPSMGSGSYRCVTLSKGGERRTRYLHELVLTTFVGPRPEGAHSCHFPNGKEDNSLTNLRWGTPAENGADKVVMGTAAKGESHSQAKLLEHEVREIRALVSEGASLGFLSKEYGVKKSTIKWIADGKTWRHLL